MTSPAISCVAWPACAESGAAAGAPAGRGMRSVGVGAHPVVQIKEHRRSLRRRIQQFPETAEHVRTDGLAFVLRQQKAIDSFPGVDVEMVEPEVGQYFWQLPLAVNRTNDFLLRQLSQRDVGFALNLLTHWCRPAVRAIRRRLPSGTPRLEERLGEGPIDLGGAHAERSEGAQPIGQRLVRQPIRTELAIDVGIDASLAQCIEIGGAWTKRDAVEHVERARFVSCRRGASQRQCGERRGERCTHGVGDEFLMRPHWISPAFP